MASVAAVPGAGGRRLAVISGKMSPPRSPRFRGGAGGGLAHCKEFEPVLKLAGGLRRGILAVAKAASSEHPRKLAVRNEPTPATGERPAARRVFGQKAVWLRCSSVTDRWGYAPSSRLAILPFARKQARLRILKQALSLDIDVSPCGRGG